MNDEDEQWYFIKAKRIKITSSKEQSKKLTAVVHV